MSKKILILVVVIAAATLVLAGCSYIQSDSGEQTAVLQSAQTMQTAPSTPSTPSTSSTQSAQSAPAQSAETAQPPVEGSFAPNIMAGAVYSAPKQTKSVTVDFYTADGSVWLGGTRTEAGASFKSLAPATLPDGTLVTSWSQSIGGEVFEGDAVYDDADFYVKTCSFVITLNYGFGKSDVLTVPDGQSYSLSEPSQTGYRFEGWQDADGNDVQTGEDVFPHSSTSLTARWIANEYVVYLDAGEGVDCAASANVVYGEKVRLPKPSREGYLFGGWYVNGAKVTDGSGNGDVWRLDGAALATARWLKSSATFSDSESYVITDSGRDDQHKDRVDLSALLGAPIADYIAAGATKLQVYYSVEIAEINDGYQYLFLSNDSRGKTFSSALLFTECIQHGVLHKDCNSYLHEGVVTVPLCKVADTVYLLYGASGWLDDDWNRNSVKVTFTVL